MTSAPSANSFTISGTTLNHYSTATIRVNNLSRSVVVRSSGTDVTANAGYVENLVTNASSFAVSYGEFDYLGNTSCGYGGKNCGITFLGTSVLGSLSSSTIRGGFQGVYLFNSSSSSLTSNIFLNLSGSGIYFESGSHHVVTSNYFYNIAVSATNSDSSSYNVLTSNTLFNDVGGIALSSSGSENNILISNTAYNMSGSHPGLDVLSNNTLVSNVVYNDGDGIMLRGQNNLVVSNLSYNNISSGIRFLCFGRQQQHPYLQQFL